MKTPCVHYDSEADAVFVLFHRHARSAKTVVLDANRMVDYDVAGNLAFVEFLDISQGADLTDVPERPRVAEALAALARRQGWPWASTLQ